MNIDEIILKSEYYINLYEEKNTLIFKFPPNKVLNLDDFYLFYTTKPYGVLITDYIKRRIDCPEYAVTSIIFSDLLFQCKKREMSMEFIFCHKEKVKLDMIKKGGQLECKLLDALIGFLENKEPKIEDDILEGYNSVINFINEKIC